MRKTYLLVAVLLAAGFAGCVHEDEGEDRIEVQRGDFVRVHYVARYQSNGTVIESSVDGSYPGDTEPWDVPFEDHLTAQFWIYAWHPSETEGETGRELVTNVRFRDINDDGFRESMFETTADVVREGGNLTHRNRNISFHDVPLAVIGDPNIVVQGFYEALLGHQPGDRLDDVVVPPEKAYGEQDPEQVQNVPRILEDRPRNLTNQSRAEVEARSNLSDDTREGDVIEYALFNETRVDARVTSLSKSQVDLYVLLEEGQTVRIPDLWDATVVNVNETAYDLRHEPEVGSTYRFQQQGGSQSFVVLSLNETHMELDFNDPRAGETIVYDVEILDAVRPDLSALFRGTTVDPFQGGKDTIHDVALLSRTNMLVASDRGLFLTLNFGERWFPFTLDSLGPKADLVQTGVTRSGEVWASVDGRLWHTNNTGYNWTVRSPEASPVVAVGQARADGDALYAVVDGEGLYRSDDRGRTWSQVSEELTGAGGIAVGPGETTTVWAATGSGLRRSTDGGATFEDHSFVGSDVADVAVVDDHTLYAVVDGNLTVSVDGGENWETRAGGQRELTRFAYARSQPDRLVATNQTGGLFLSVNGGRLWPALR